MTSKRSIASIQRDEVPYSSHYCEENVYKLIEKLYNEVATDGEDESLQIYAVVVSNAQKQTVVWQQRLCEDSPNEPVIWDYHVIVLVTSSVAQHQLVFDYDSLLPYPCDSSEYILKAFRPQMQLPPEFRQLFRVISAQEYLTKFSSDRSHMVNSDMPEPNWPIICGAQARTAMELPSLWAMSNDDIHIQQDGQQIGKVMDVKALLNFARNGV